MFFWYIFIYTNGGISIHTIIQVVVVKHMVYLHLASWGSKLTQSLVETTSWIFNELGPSKRIQIHSRTY